jgi:toxin-antitoxin system PIN domain toxin
VTPDVNVVVAASRSDHPHHRQALSWLQDALRNCAGGASFHLLPMVATSFVRLVTNPKVFVQPTPLPDAMAFVDAILAVPGADMPQLGPEWNEFRRLCLDKGLTGNLVPDAWIAAAVKAGGFHLVTFDRGFAELLPRADRTLLIA